MSIDLCFLMYFNVRVAPAPLDLCYVRGFDLWSDTTVCPPERNILNDFYLSAKGKEWTEGLEGSDKWTGTQNNHCDWFGVTCNDLVVTELNLMNNGLSGKLNSRISELSSLEVLDLSDNDIKVRVGCCVFPCLPLPSASFDLSLIMLCVLH